MQHRRRFFQRGVRLQRRLKMLDRSGLIALLDQDPAHQLQAPRVARILFQELGQLLARLGHFALGDIDLSEGRAPPGVPRCALHPFFTDNHRLHKALLAQVGVTKRNTRI